MFVRRTLEGPADWAHYLTDAPDRTPLKPLMRVAGCWWGIEECFEQAMQ